MSRKTVLFVQKVAGLRRKGLENFHVLFPVQTVKGKGTQSGYRKGEHGFTKFPAINTNKVCTLPMKATKVEVLTRLIK